MAADRAATIVDGLIEAAQICNNAFRLVRAAVFVIEADIASNPCITTEADVQTGTEKAKEAIDTHNISTEGWEEAKEQARRASVEFEVATGAADRGLHLVAHKVSLMRNPWQAGALELWDDHLFFFADFCSRPGIELSRQQGSASGRPIRSMG